LRANIFVPAAIPEGKLAQLLIYGARVFKVEARYDIAWRLCMDACERFGWYNRNCAVNPYLVEGKKTGGLEVAEQCAGDPPGWVAVSVGDGCTVAGIGKGLREARETGLVSWRARLLAVQAAGAAPLAQAFEAGAENFDVVAAEGEAARWSGTFADSINCPAPRNGAKALRAVRESGGHFVTVSDEEIREAARRAGGRTGVFGRTGGRGGAGGRGGGAPRGHLGRTRTWSFSPGPRTEGPARRPARRPRPHVIPAASTPSPKSSPLRLRRGTSDRVKWSSCLSVNNFPPIALGERLENWFTGRTAKFFGKGGISSARRHSPAMTSSSSAFCQDTFRVSPQEPKAVREVPW
jgi:threonine synthase